MIHSEAQISEKIHFEAIITEKIHHSQSEEKIWEVALQKEQ